MKSFPKAKKKSMCCKSVKGTIPSDLLGNPSTVRTERVSQAEAKRITAAKFGGLREQRRLRPTTEERCGKVERASGMLRLWPYGN